MNMEEYAEMVGKTLSQYYKDLAKQEAENVDK